jgi:hypothetical protein
MERVRGRRLAPAKKLVSFLHSRSLPLSWGIPPKEEEEKGRKTPPLGGVFYLRDWVRVARRLVPLPGQGTLHKISAVLYTLGDQDVKTIKDFLDYLSRKTGFSFSPVFARSYDEMDFYLFNGKADLAYICGAPYVEGHKKWALPTLSQNITKP